MQYSAQPPVKPLLLTIDQVSQVMHLGRSKIYELINNEGLPVQRFGKAVRVPYESLQKWLQERGATN